MPVEVFSAEQAQSNLRRSAAIWPDGRKTRNRLGKYTVCESRPSFNFSHEDLIFTIGSCFARNIERKLASLGFQLPTMALEIPQEERVSATANEILNKYTTAAIVNELKWILGLEAFPEDGFVPVGDDLVCDPHLHPGLPPVNLERAKARRAQVHALGTALPECRIVIVTLGLVETWHDKKTGLYLNGAPPRAVIKAEPERFSLHRLAYEDILADLEQVHAILKEHGHPEFKMIVSVSPVPFKSTYSGQDAIAANTYSKSVLRAVAEKFCTAHDNVDYFPSYEMVVLSERGSAYNDDNIHVRDEMVSRIMELAAERYVASYKSEGTNDALWEHRDNPHLLYQVALEARAQGRFDEAIEVMKYLDDAGLVAKAKVEPADFYIMYGTTLARAGQNGLAEPYLARAVALLPNQARPLFKLGLITARLRRREALTLFERAAAMEPSSEEYLQRLALQYEREKRPDQAVEVYRKVLSLQPGHEGATVALRRLKSFEDAA